MLQRTALSQALEYSLRTKTPSLYTSRVNRFQTRLFTMPPAPKLPPFTTHVVNAMRSLYPEELADRSWDNVGLLLENTANPDSAQPKVVITSDLTHLLTNLNTPQGEVVEPRVLLTNDLTILVAEEAIRLKASVIVAYHPFLFRPIKSISLSDPHQRIILQLAQNNIAVYSPHTALDAAPGGMADWLADMLPTATSSSAVRKIANPLPESASIPAGSGYGREVHLDKPVLLTEVIKAYAKGLGGQRYLMVARPKGMTKVKSVAVCPGSGFDVLKDCDVDLIVTGEVTHHNALRAVMLGKCVIAAFHSNSERTFLKEKLRPSLEGLLREKVWDAEVVMSETDEDPFEIVDVNVKKIQLRQ